MPLTPEQLQLLRQNCNTMPLAQLKKYAQNGLITSTSELPGLDPARKAEIDAIIASRPNPEERNEWAQASALASQAIAEPDMQRAIDALNTYAAHWQQLRPLNNNVDDAIAMAQQLESRLNAYRAQIEENDWQNVWNIQQGTVDALLGHLYKYPNSAHLAEIDDAVWMELLRNPDRSMAASQYRSYFPAGRHIGEVEQIERARTEWEDVKAYADPVEIKQYLDKYPSSPFMQEATALISELKRAELDRMRQQGGAYDSQYLLKLIDNNVFTEHELTMAKVIEYGDIEDIRNIERDREGLPDIMAEIHNCRLETAQGCTDVFLFGIPSTGKSCILMGLLNSPKLNYNTVHGGGSYAAALTQYVNSGITIPPTPGDFMATIQATIMTPNAQHPVNLVEMSGEEFAFKLANNDRQHISFADMGKGAPELLRNDNRKIFFIIVDPTTVNIRFTHAVPMRDEYGAPILNAEGKEILEPRTYNLIQSIMLSRMIDILMDPTNEEVMKKVDAIHFIVTKSDVLDKNAAGNDRETEAYNRFLTTIGNKLQPLIRFCTDHDINATNDRRTNGHPRLYTFSLGKFKMGGLFKYVSYDSDKIIDVIMENTGAVREEKFSDRFLRIVNQPIF